MNIFSGLDKIVKQDYPLAKETWLGIGGPADYFIRPTGVDELKDAVTRCSENDLPVRVLGFGSNLLIRDEGIRGAVIKLDSPAFSNVDFNDNTLVVGAGAELSELVLTCAKKGLSGMEGLTGIPGSMGGAVRMNAGGRFGDIGTITRSVTLMDAEGNIFEKARPELNFDYRSVNITAKFILDATLELAPAEPEQITKNVKEIWIYKKNNQPLGTHNAGCIFKNPRGNSAGALIDRAGLKGTVHGKARISEKHANFIIADDDCSSADVMKLIDICRKNVKDQFDIDLELEVEIW